MTSADDSIPIYDVARLGLAVFFLGVVYLFALLSSMVRLDRVTKYASKWSSQRILMFFIVTTLGVRFVSFGVLAVFSFIKNSTPWYPLVVVLFTLPEFLVLSTYVMIFFHWLETYVFAHDQFLITSKSKFGKRWRAIMITANVCIYGGMAVMYIIMMLKPNVYQDRVVELIMLVTAWSCFIFPALMLCAVVGVGCIALAGFPFTSLIAQERVSTMNWVFIVWTLGRMVRGTMLLLTVAKKWQQDLNDITLVVVTVATLALAEFFPFMFTLDWSVIGAMLLGVEAEGIGVIRAQTNANGYESTPNPNSVVIHRGSSVRSDVDDSKWDIPPKQLTLENGGGGDFITHGSFNGLPCYVRGFRLENMTDAMLRELQDHLIVCSSVDHPNIAGFLGVSLLGDKTLCCVTNHYPSTLRAALDRKDPLHAYKLAGELCDALQYIHAFDQVHGYLSSNCVFLDEQQNIKLDDVGSRKIRIIKEASIVTRINTVWTAPEVLLGQVSDKYSDIYSYGVIVWEMLTGGTPWEDMRDMKQVTKAVCDDKLRLIVPSEEKLAAKGIPTWLTTSIRNCFNVDPQQRPTFADMHEQFTQHQV